MGVVLVAVGTRALRVASVIHKSRWATAFPRMHLGRFPVPTFR